MKRIEMNFLPDMSAPYELCGDARFMLETLAVNYGGKDIGKAHRLKPVTQLP